MENSLPAQVKQGAENADHIIRSLEQATTAAPGVANPDETATQQLMGSQTTTGTPPETLEQQYRSLKGKYDSEVPRMAQEMNKLRANLSLLVTENADLKAQLQESRGTDTSQRPANQSLDPDAFGDYGEEFVKLAQKVNLLEEENTRLKTAAPAQSAPSKADLIGTDLATSFYARVKDQIPDLDALNVDPALLKWLGEATDPTTGFSYQDILASAEKRFDHDVAIRVFNQFKHQFRAQPNAGASPPIYPVTANVSEFAGLPPGQAGKVWTRSEINQFYRAVREGKYVGKDQDKAATEADIFRASAEGRVRG